MDAPAGSPSRIGSPEGPFDSALCSMTNRERESAEMLIANANGNARTLLIYCIKLEKRLGIYKREAWEDWLRDYKVRG